MLSIVPVSKRQLMPPKNTTKKPAAPTFREALETSRVCDAIIASGKSGRWVKL